MIIAALLLGIMLIVPIMAYKMNEMQKKNIDQQHELESKGRTNNETEFDLAISESLKTGLQQKIEDLELAKMSLQDDIIIQTGKLKNKLTVWELAAYFANGKKSLEWWRIRIMNAPECQWDNQTFCREKVGIRIKTIDSKLRTKVCSNMHCDDRKFGAIRVFTQERS